MGFFIRKSKRVGAFRLNFSRSGIGISSGIPGLRLGSGPRGNYVHVGKGGVYYRKTVTPKGKSSKTEKAGRDDLAQPEADGATAAVAPMQAIDSADTTLIVDAESSDLIEELRNKRKKLRIGICMLIGAFVAFFAAGYQPEYGQALAVTGFLLFLFTPFGIVADHYRKTTVIIYDFDDEGEKRFWQIHDAVEALRRSNRLWHISAQGNVREKKYQAGADSVVNRHRIKPRFKKPPYIKTNVSIPCLPAGSQNLYFFPDRLLVLDKKNVGAVDYRNLNIEIGESHFVERESVPKDARRVGTTWQYVNKSGGPDKRFKDNKQFPVMEYESARLSSETGLNEEFMVSKVGRFETLRSALLNAQPDSE